MRATMSLLGLYKFQPDILDWLILPDGYNKTTFINNLLIETAEFEILYSDPDFLKFAIGQWANKEKAVWDELAKTLEYEYNPIHNYDRTETHIMDFGEHYVNSHNDSGSGTDDNINKNKVTGYNDDTLVTREQTEDDGSSSFSNSGGSTDDKTGQNRETIRAQGNVGVMSTQQMIEEQRNVVEFNLYDYIIRSFMKRFCLMVY